MTDEEKQTLKLKSLSNLMLKVDQLRSDFYFTDITLQSGDKEFPAHKIILSAFSPYFEKLFKDPQTKLKSKLSVDFMSAEVLEIIISYCYAGYIDEVETVKKNIKNILSVSLKLELPALSEYCCQLLLNVITNEELLPYWRLIDQINNEEIKQKYVEKVAKNFETLRNEAEILKITANQINSLLQCPLIAFQNEGDILNLILQWVKHREEEDDFAAVVKESDSCREKHMNELLEKVNFSKISESYLLELFDEPLLENNKNYLKACKQIYYNKLMKDNPKTTALEASPIREDFFKLTNCNNTNKLSTSEKISVRFSTHFSSTEKNNLEKQAEKNEIVPELLSCDSSNHKNAELVETVKYHKKVFMILGSPTGSDIFIYDFQNDKMMKMIAHPFLILTKAAVCKQGCYIYGLGGWDTRRQSTFLNYCYAYNTIDEKWLQKKPFETALLEPQAITIKDQIYVVQLIGHILNLKLYEPEKEILVQLPYMSLISYNSRNNATFSITSGEEYLYVLLDKQIWSYHTQSKEQKKVVTLEKLCSSSNIKFVYCYGKLYIIEHEKPKRVLIYDLQSSSFFKGFIPEKLTLCNAMMSMDNPNYPEIFVVGSHQCFLYRPPISWEPIQGFNTSFHQELQIVLF